MGLRKKKSLIDQAPDTVRSHVESAVATAKDKARPILADARDKAAPVLADARAKAAPVLADARDKAAPVIADARAKAGPMIAEGAARAADKAAIGAAIAAEKAAHGRDLAAARLAEFSAEPPKKKGGKFKKFLLLTGLAAVGAAVFKKVKGAQASDNWQSSYVPSPPPAPVADAADDGAGSSPDEAIADASEQPHAASTPDNPAETVTLDQDAAKKS